MDTLCRCGEPWDWRYIRDEVLEDQALYERMEKSGGYVGEREFGGGVVELTGLEIKNHELGELGECWQFKPGPYPIQCPCCFGKDVEPDPNSDIVEAMQDLLGDDIDGLMAELEDMGLV